MIGNTILLYLYANEKKSAFAFMPDMIDFRRLSFFADKNSLLCKLQSTYLYIQFLSVKSFIVTKFSFLENKLNLIIRAFLACETDNLHSWMIPG